MYKFIAFVAINVFKELAICKREILFFDIFARKFSQELIYGISSYNICMRPLFKNLVRL